MALSISSGSFDSASRDETARGSAQDDNSYRYPYPAINRYVDTAYSSQRLRRKVIHAAR